MSDWSDVFEANPDALGRVLAEAATEFVCLATSHGEPFYLNPAGRRLVGLDESQPASSINLREFYTEPSWGELRDTAGPAVNRTGQPVSGTTSCIWAHPPSRALGARDGGSCAYISSSASTAFCRSSLVAAFSVTLAPATM